MVQDACRTEFDVLVEVLHEITHGSGEVYEQGRGAERDLDREIRRQVDRQIRESQTARLALFTLAIEVARETADSPEAECRELQQFARAVDDRFGVDILRTAALHRNRLPSMPDGLLERV